MPKEKLILPATDRDISAIGSAPEGTRPIYWDAGVPCLGLRVTDKGSKTFVFVRRVKGGPTLKTAKDRREVTAPIRRVLIGRWRGRAARDIRNRDVVRMVREIIAAGGDRPAPGSRRKVGGPSAARHALATARHIFSWAVEQDEYGITGNPIVISAKTAHGRAPRRTRVLDDWELRAIWWASFKARPHPYGPIIRMLTITGQPRLNEIARARRGELDLDDGPGGANTLLTVRPERMKQGEGSAGHTVPLTPWPSSSSANCRASKATTTCSRRRAATSRSRASARPRGTSTSS